ncbi:WD repeat-containing protein 60 [Clonorchis sinensis]|uniref:WD repeat-containing protein 60 n=1 Tax=Clonorchis sinensis TaxID=79923 RepID=H2KRS7_CLOSI|nr:WD repeat-containing protein 60 [Clonorchis sinensis]
MNKDDRGTKPIERKSSDSRRPKDSSHHGQNDKKLKATNRTTKSRANPEAGDYNRSEEPGLPRSKHKSLGHAGETESSFKMERYNGRESDSKRKLERSEPTKQRHSQKEKDSSRKRDSLLKHQESYKIRSSSDGHQTVQKHPAEKVAKNAPSSNLSGHEDYSGKLQQPEEISSQPLNQSSDRARNTGSEKGVAAQQVFYSRTKANEHFIHSSEGGRPQPNLPSKERQRVESYVDDFEDYGSDFEQVDSDNPQSSASEDAEHGGRAAASQQCDDAQDNFSPCVWSTVANSNSSSGSKTRNHQPEQQIENSQFIDFKRSLQCSHSSVQRRVLRRAHDLRRVIDLEFDGCGHVFELRPLDEYTTYMVRYGKADRSQAQVQTNEDALDRDIQTEPVETCKGGGVWTQWPPLDTGECFGAAIHYDLNSTRTPMVYEDAFTAIINELVGDFLPDHRRASIAAKDSHTTLSRGALPQTCGLLKQLRLIFGILEEEAIQDSGNVPAQDLFHSDEDTSEKLTHSVYGSSGCLFCEFAPFNGDRLITVHGANKLLTSDTSGDRCGFNRPSGDVIYVWSISDGSGLPQFQLFCPGLSAAENHDRIINCAGFSPDSAANYVIGGLTDGSLCLWDLCHLPYELQSHRSATKHLKTQATEGLASCRTRFPIYSTSGIEIQKLEPTPYVHTFHLEPMGKSDASNHHAGIIALEWISVLKGRPMKSDFQFAALDCSGELSIWLIMTQGIGIRKNVYETMAGSQVDLGLRPSRHTVRMLRLMYLSVRVPCFELPPFTSFSQEHEEDRAHLQSKTESCRRPKAVATVMSITPEGNFLIGFNDGRLVQQSRSTEQIIYPKQFECPSSRAALNCLAVHPERMLNIVVAGYTDGVIRLFSMRHPFVLQQWYLSQCRVQLDSAIKICWTQSLPSVFFSLSSSGQVCSWDILGNLTCKGVSLITEEEQREKNQNYPDVNSNRITDFSLGHNTLVNMDGTLVPSTAIALIYPTTVKIQWLQPDSVGTVSNDLAYLKTHLDCLIAQ